MNRNTYVVEYATKEELRYLELNGERVFKDLKDAEQAARTSQKELKNITILNLNIDFFIEERSFKDGRLIRTRLDITDAALLKEYYERIRKRVVHLIEEMDRENPSKREENLNKFNALFQKLDVIDARVEFLLLKEVL